MERNAKTYWWTYTGIKGGPVTLLGHDDRDTAEYHYSLAHNLGGAFDALGRSLKRVTEAEARAGLGNKFATIKIDYTNQSQGSPQ